MSKTHGDSCTILHKKWRSMKNRCNNSNEKRYYDYGGRGIKVCDEWNDDYIKFKDWALKNGYNEKLQIDRINNNGNYEPSNCRWVTQQQNVFNKPGSKKSSSKYKGVSWNKKNKNWRANITIKCKEIRKQYNIGSFKTEIDAATAYNKRAKELFGEHAYLNRIEND
jgi:hypothetical protein